MKFREVWEECMPQLFSTAMYNAREDAMAEAGVENIKDCRDFPPAWLSREIWNKLINVWETSEWQKKSKIATNNHLRLNQGFGVVIHVGGTAPTTRHEKNLEAELGREPLYMETYDWTHKRKGSNDYCDLRSKIVAVEALQKVGFLGIAQETVHRRYLGQLHARPPPDVVPEHLASRDNQVSRHQFSMSS